MAYPDNTGSPKDERIPGVPTRRHHPDWLDPESVDLRPQVARSMSADAHGRAIWGLAIAATEARDPNVRTAALRALARLAPPKDPSLRHGVYAALGATYLLRRIPDHRLANQIVNPVVHSLPRITDTGGIWPEVRLTYDNGRIPESYLARPW